MLGELSAHFLHLGAHHGVLLAHRGEVLLERGDIVNSPAECLPLAGLVVLGLREAGAKRLEAILHFTATLALGKFVCDAQFGCSTVWGVAGARLGFPNEIANLFMLQRVVVYIGG